MSQHFKGFSDAAKLYAQHYQTVEAMFGIFYEEMQAFCDALTESIRPHVPAEMLRHKRSGNKDEVDGMPPYRYWWLGKDQRARQHPYLWLDTWNATMLAGERFWLGASAPKFSEEQLLRFWAIPSQEGSEAFCELDARRKWSAFRVHFDAGGTDALEVAGKRIAKVLNAMHTIEANTKS